MTPKEILAHLLSDNQTQKELAFQCMWESWSDRAKKSFAHRLQIIDERGLHYKEEGKSVLATCQNFAYLHLDNFIKNMNNKIAEGITIKEPASLFYAYLEGKLADTQKKEKKSIEKMPIVPQDMTTRANTTTAKSEAIADFEELEEKVIYAITQETKMSASEAKIFIQQTLHNLDYMSYEKPTERKILHKAYKKLYKYPDIFTFTKKLIQKLNPYHFLLTIYFLLK